MPRISSRLTIRNKLFELREKKHITQQELADEVGVTRATVIAVEKGSYNPSLELAFRVAQYFDIGIEKIFWVEEE